MRKIACLSRRLCVSADFNHGYLTAMKALPVFARAESNAEIIHFPLFANFCNTENLVEFQLMKAEFFPECNLNDYEIFP